MGMASRESQFSPRVHEIDIPSCKGSSVLAQLLRDTTITPIRESRFWVRMTDSLVQKGLKPEFNTLHPHPNRNVTNQQLDLLEREILLKLSNASSPGCAEREHFPRIFCGDSDFFIQSNVGSPLTTLQLNTSGIIPDDIGEQVHCMAEKLLSVRVRHLDTRCDHFTLTKQGTLGMFDFNKAVILSPSAVTEISSQVAREFDNMKDITLDDEHHQLHMEQRACFCVFEKSIPIHLKSLIQKLCNGNPIDWTQLMFLVRMLEDPSVKNETLAKIRSRLKKWHAEQWKSRAELSVNVSSVKSVHVRGRLNIRA